MFSLLNVVQLIPILPSLFHQIHFVDKSPANKQSFTFWGYRYRYGHTDKQQTNTNTDTPFPNLYQTDTDICFEIHIKPIPMTGIYLY